MQTTESDEELEAALLKAMEHAPKQQERRVTKIRIDARLAGMLADDNSRARASALAELYFGDKTELDLAAPKIIKMLTDSKLEVRRNALIAMTRLDADKVAECKDTVCKMLTDRVAVVRENAWCVLSKLDVTLLLTIVSQHMSKLAHASPETQESVLAGVVAMDQQTVKTQIDAVAAALLDRDVNVRLLAVKVMLKLDAEALSQHAGSIAARLADVGWTLGLTNDVKEAIQRMLEEPVAPLLNTLVDVACELLQDKTSRWGDVRRAAIWLLMQVVSSPGGAVCAVRHASVEDDIAKALRSPSNGSPLAQSDPLVQAAAEVHAVMYSPASEGRKRDREAFEKQLAGGSSCSTTAASADLAASSEETADQLIEAHVRKLIESADLTELTFKGIRKSLADAGFEKDSYDKHWLKQLVDSIVSGRRGEQ